MSPKTRLGDEERRLMHLVPAPAVRLMKRRVLSRPGVNSLMVLIFHTPGLHSSFLSLVRDLLIISLSLSRPDNYSILFLSRAAKMERDQLLEGKKKIMSPARK